MNVRRRKHRAVAHRIGATGAAVATVLFAAGALAQTAPSADAGVTPGGANDGGALPDPVDEPAQPQPTDPEVEGNDTSGDTSGEGSGEGSGANGAGGARGRAPAEDAAETREAPLTEDQRARMIPSDGELPDPNDRAPRRFFFPPYLREWGRDHDTTVLFPFYWNSRVRDSRWLLIPPYYRLRSRTANADAFFPLFYHGTGTSADGSNYSTTIVPPVWVHRTRGPERARSLAFGAFPLFSYYENFGANGRLQGEHLIIPALLTFHRWSRTSQHTITPLFQYVRDGSSTTWTAGPVIPLVARHSSPNLRWTLVWPALFFQRNDLLNDRHLTVVGPFWTERTSSSLSVNLAPVFFHAHDRTSSRTTVFPLFHTESSREHFTLATLLGGYTRVRNESTLILPFYQNHRGVSSFDAVAPFFYYSREPRTGSSTIQVLNFVHNRRATGSTTVFFPLFAHIHEEGRFDTTITPVFGHSYDQTRRSRIVVAANVHYESSPEHRVVNVYPIWYSAAGRRWHHNVFFPFVWDIGNQDEGRQTTVIFPFYANVGDRRGYTRWAFPDVFWWRHGSGESLSWGYDIAPFFQYGEPRRGDYYWSVLYGLAGFRRQGNYEQTRVFWATINNRRPPNGRADNDADRDTSGPRRAGTTRVDRDVIVDL
ncbi:MAG: hypothetical protein JNK05_06625 [Myxococcales bacterium]|nr:hypothetical protein [Myxococcales bacterium]